MADSAVEVIESKFDWSEIDLENIGEIKLMQQLHASPAKFNTGIIPECDIQGYSIVNIDDLDNLILQSVQKPITIAQLLNDIKDAFDTEELEQHYDEFEQLIFGRIKMALQTKIITAIM